jgi:hypothetical protein
VAATTSGTGPFAALLTEPSTPGSTGWATVRWASGSGEPPGVYTFTAPSGVFAAMWPTVMY